MKVKYFFANVKEINQQDRTITAVASTSDKDRDGEVILPSAFTESLGPFKANPVILATHHHRLNNGSSPVIGSAIPESIAVSEKEVTFTMRFADTPLGEEYWKLYRDKHMRAFSIGFIPEKWEDSRDEQSQYSMRTYTKIELLEISAVPVPSNRRALARAKGFFDDDEVEKNIPETIAELKSDIENLKNIITEQLDEIKSLLIPDSEGLAREFRLGNSLDSSASAGDKDKTEKLLNTLNEIKTEVKEN